MALGVLDLFRGVEVLATSWVALGVLDLFQGVEVLVKSWVALGVLDLFQGVEVLAGSWVALGVLDLFLVRLSGWSYPDEDVTLSPVRLRVPGPCPWEESIKTDETS